MQKIVSLFKRDYEGNRQVFDEVFPGAEWVFEGQGVATQKYDGTCCLVRDGRLFKRHELKKGKTAPPDFEAAQEPDEVTGDTPGWVPVGDGAEDRWHREAFANRATSPASMGWPDGTYELVGPKVQGNPERATSHLLLRHGGTPLLDAPRDFEGLRVYLAAHDIEGIVWHHPDGRRVKIKARDFGIKRKR